MLANLMIVKRINHRRFAHGAHRDFLKFFSVASVVISFPFQLDT